MAILRAPNKLDARPPETASLAAKKPGEMIATGDLHGILYNAAAQANSLDSFGDSVVSSLDGALGPNNYVASLSLAKNGSGGGYLTSGNKLANAAVWCGEPGLLPGVVAQYYVTLTVFTG
ncbi:hypothetical protein [Inquilinus sp.]|jgi:hypothetical protein|uniref:hypothetical protein n=1 Tax=Inquilinus sp. TaxID=1932117 RepID=UPI0037848CF4